MAEGNVLVVDNCRMSNLLLRFILSKEGIRTETASAGPEALEKSLAKNFDLIFLEILLPGMNGIEVAKKIHDQVPTSPPKIVLLTAMGEDYRPDMVSESGAEAIFFKPIKPSEIVDVARASLKETVCSPS